MTPTVRNLLDQRPRDEGREEFQTLMKGASFRLESIYSGGQSGDPDFWYDQPHSEWVLLLKGTACLTFEGDGELLLRAGDYFTIPPRCRHRVHSTSLDAVWLALHEGAAE